MTSDARKDTNINHNKRYDLRCKKGNLRHKKIKKKSNKKKTQPALKFKLSQNLCYIRLGRRQVFLSF